MCVPFLQRATVYYAWFCAWSIVAIRITAAINPSKSPTMHHDTNRTLGISVNISVVTWSTDIEIAAICLIKLESAADETLSLSRVQYSSVWQQLPSSLNSWFQSVYLPLPRFGDRRRQIFSLKYSRWLTRRWGGPRLDWQLSPKASRSRRKGKRTSRMGQINSLEQRKSQQVCGSWRHCK